SFILAGIAVVPVGLYPQAARAVEGQPIGAVEGVVGRNVGRTRLQVAAIRVLDGIARQYEQIPFEGRGGGVATRLAPANNLAVDVFGARVGGVGCLAFVVVGQRYIDLAAGRVDTDPFRPVHLGGAYGVGGKAGIDQYLGLGLEAGIGRQGCIGGLVQKYPLSVAHEVAACRAFVEPGDVQLARIQQVRIVAVVAVSAVRDELINI